MAKEVLKNRKNETVEELTEIVTMDYQGTTLTFEEVYYLDDDVNEDTGEIIKGKKVQFYKENQVSRNLKTLKKSYLESIINLNNITSEQGYKVVSKRIDLLLTKVNDKTPKENELSIELELLSDLIEKYEDKHYKI